MGKAVFVLLLSCFGVMLPSALFAEKVEKSDFTVTEIKIDFRNSPMFQYQNINDTFSNSARSKWAVMEITFVPASAGTRSGWYDDITMEATMVMTTSSEVTSGDSSAKPSTVYAVFTGKTRFFTIPADDRGHSGMFFIPAKLMDRFFPKGKGFNAGMFTAGRVEFYTRGRVLLGEGYWTGVGSGRKTAPSPKLRNDFADFDRKYPNSIKLPGGLYSKEKTPWAFYRYDFYDLIYEDGIMGGGKAPDSSEK